MLKKWKTRTLSMLLALSMLTSVAAAVDVEQELSDTQNGRSPTTESDARLHNSSTLGESEADIYRSRSVIDSQEPEFVIDEQGTLTKYNGPGGDVVIPNGVKKIGDHLFLSNHSISSVYIPEGVTNIGAGAFYGSSLVSVEIPDSVTRIESFAFYICKNLTSITIPQKVTKIESALFDGCSSLISVNILGNITEIGNNAFRSCIKLNNITIPNSVIRIGESSFSGCNKLEILSLPDNLEYIGVRAFGGAGIRSLTIPNKVKTIDNEAFLNCKELKEPIEVPNNVTKIGFAAFQGCSKLPSIELPDNLTSLGTGYYEYGSAFKNCTSLSSVKLPKSLTEIPQCTFEGCSALSKIDIPNSVIKIGDYAFSHSGLTTINLSKNIKEIGEEAFSNTSLVVVNLSDSNITNIGEEAFRNCSFLSSVYLSPKLNKIEAYTFSNCPRLVSVFTPDSLVSIDDTTFYESENLTIYCSPESYAETYAKEHGIPFSTGATPDADYTIQMDAIRQLKPGEFSALQIILYDSDGNICTDPPESMTVSVSSDNNDVATVELTDASGQFLTQFGSATAIVKGIAKGSAKITATLSNGATAVCNVVVDLATINDIIGPDKLHPGESAKYTISIGADGASLPDYSVKWNVAPITCAVVSPFIENPLEAQVTIHDAVALPADKTSVILTASITNGKTYTKTIQIDRDSSWTPDSNSKKTRYQADYYDVITETPTLVYKYGAYQSTEFQLNWKAGVMKTIPTTGEPEYTDAEKEAFRMQNPKVMISLPSELYFLNADGSHSNRMSFVLSTSGGVPALREGETFPVKATVGIKNPSTYQELFKVQVTLIADDYAGKTTVVTLRCRNEDTPPPPPPVPPSHNNNVSGKNDSKNSENSGNESWGDAGGSEVPPMSDILANIETALANKTFDITATKLDPFESLWSGPSNFKMRQKYTENINKTLALWLAGIKSGLIKPDVAKGSNGKDEYQLRLRVHTRFDRLHGKEKYTEILITCERMSWFNNLKFDSLKWSAPDIGFLSEAQSFGGGVFADGDKFIQYLSDELKSVQRDIVASLIKKKTIKGEVKKILNDGLKTSDAWEFIQTAVGFKDYMKGEAYAALGIIDMAY